MSNRKERTQLNVEVSPEEKHQMKLDALNKRVTLKKWAHQALIAYLNRESNSTTPAAESLSLGKSLKDGLIKQRHHADSES